MKSGCSAPTHSGSHVSAWLRDELVQPEIARRRERDVAAGTPVDDDVADALAPAHAQRLVDDRLERHVLAAARLLVGGDHGDGAGVDDAFLQRLRRKAAEHDRMRRADARAGLHRDHALDRHRHVDEDAVALPDAERTQAVREAADPLEQLPVSHLRHGAVVGLEDDRDLLGIAVRDVAVEAVVGHIELPVLEPLVERRVRLVERLRERLLPQYFVPGELRPEAREVAGGAALSASKSAFFTFAWATNSRGGSKIRCSCDTDSIVDMRSSPPEVLPLRESGRCAPTGRSLTKRTRSPQSAR